MGKRESYEPGTFCWVDLATTDPAGAKAFYTELFGWEAEDVPAGEGGIYTVFRLDGDEVCALYEMDAERRDQGTPPHWFSHVSVEDADAISARADQPGAEFGAWQQTGVHIGARRVNDPGCMTWNELQTRDPQVMAAFYAELFGWE